MQEKVFLFCIVHYTSKVMHVKLHSNLLGGSMVTFDFKEVKKGGVVAYVNRPSAPLLCCVVECHERLYSGF